MSFVLNYLCFKFQLIKPLTLHDFIIMNLIINNNNNNNNSNNKNNKCLTQAGEI